MDGAEGIIILTDYEVHPLPNLALPTAEAGEVSTQITGFFRLCDIRLFFK